MYLSIYNRAYIQWYKYKYYDDCYFSSVLKIYVHVLNYRHRLIFTITINQYTHCKKIEGKYQEERWKKKEWFNAIKEE